MIWQEGVINPEGRELMEGDINAEGKKVVVGVGAIVVVGLTEEVGRYW